MVGWAQLELLCKVGVHDCVSCVVLLTCKLQAEMLAVLYKSANNGYKYF